jgi:hypothetical protein
MYVLDDNGQPIVILGKVDEPGTQPIYNGAIIVNPANGIPMLQMTDHAGQLLPYVPWSGWHRTTDAEIISDNVLQSRWTVDIEIATSVALKVQVPVGADVGTTGEVRVRHQISGVTTNLKVIGSGASDIFDCFWLHPMSLQTGPGLFHVDARRTSGAGNIYVYHPGPLTFGSYTIQATSGGWI